MPHDKGAKKYTTYLELVDTGSSSSQMDKTLINSTGFETKTTKETLWGIKSVGFTLYDNINLT
jgi:hypothetical protein